MMNVLVRADADSRIGTGHVMRCLALAAALRELGCRVTFLSRCDSETLRKRIIDEGHELAEIDTTHPDALDLPRTVEELVRRQCDWLVADGYDFDETYHAAVRRSGVRLLVIDDSVRLGYYDADVIVNQNVHAAAEYPTAPGGLVLHGPKYALLRSEFRAASRPEDGIGRSVRRVLVTFGGGDAHNVTEAVLDALASGKSGFELDVVVGSANQRVDALRERVDRTGGRVRLYQDVPDMAALMAQADLAISAAGSTALELAAMGVPALLVVTAANQEAVASAMQSAGTAESLGSWDALTEESLRAAVDRLAADASARLAQRRSGLALVDGNGAHRVARTIVERAAPCENGQTLHLRPASVADADALWRLANDPGVRSQSLNPEPIPLDTHLAWYARRLVSPETRIWVFVDASGLAAQIRYDRVQPALAEIGFAVAAGRRGAGLGTRLLRETVLLAGRALGVEWVRGLVLEENTASARAFLNAGFEETGIEARSGRVCRVFVHATNEWENPADRAGLGNHEAVISP